MGVWGGDGWRLRVSLRWCCLCVCGEGGGLACVAVCVFLGKRGEVYNITDIKYSNLGMKVL